MMRAFWSGFCGDVPKPKPYALGEIIGRVRVAQAKEYAKISLRHTKQRTELVKQWKKSN